jgi:hypothetical protein
MLNRPLLAFVFLASVINAVPSRAEFHPIRCRADPISDDFVGSGLEGCGGEALRRSAACEEPMERKVARQWRDLAERVRRLAALSTPVERRRPMTLAEDYEARAKAWEARHGRPQAG